MSDSTTIFIDFHENERQYNEKLDPHQSVGLKPGSAPFGRPELLISEVLRTSSRGRILVSNRWGQ